MVRKIVVYFLNSPDDFCSNPPQDFTFPKRIPFRFVCKGKRYFSNRPGKKCKTVPQTGINLINVVFPLPEAPTIAVTLPLGIVNNANGRVASLCFGQRVGHDDIFHILKF